MFKKLLTTTATVIILAAPVIASAHVIVTPGSANIGQELVFNISVPNEQQTAVTNVKLLIPSGVQNVTPTVKDGWTIQMETKGTGDTSTVDAISWTAGSIPVGQREDFSFSAAAPAKATELDWKAYQTYADGTVVHWDQKPAGSDDSSGNAGPYSVTKVVNDLQATTTATSPKSSSALPVSLSLIAIVLSAAALLFRKK